MQKEKIVQNLVEYINGFYSDKLEYYGRPCEVSLFEWGHMLRNKVNRDFGIYGDINRVLVIEAYNRTHPHRFYQINPLTLDNQNLTFENLGGF